MPKRKPKALPNHLKQCEKLFGKGDYGGVIDLCNKALEIDPTFAAALNDKGWALGLMNRHGEALLLYDEAIKLGYTRAWNSKGWSLSALSRHKEAIESYNESLRINPRDAWAWNNRGWNLDARGEYQEAIESYDKALKLDKKYAWAWNNKGQTLSHLDKHREAIDCYDKALEIDPKFAQAWNNKGVSLYELSKYKDAEEAAKRAAELKPENPLYLNNWGDLLLKLKRYDNAEKTYLRAKELKNSWKPCLGLAKVSIERGDEMGERDLYEDALEYLNEIPMLGMPEEEDDKLNYYFQRGYVNAKMGNWKEAERNFLQCHGDPKAERNIRRIRNRRRGQRRLPKAQVAGGWALAGISIAGLITIFVLYFIKFDGIKPIYSSLLKVLVPTFLFFIALGFSLPHIRSVRGPGGIGFEKEITIRPEAAPPEIKLE